MKQLYFQPTFQGHKGQDQGRRSRKNKINSFNQVYIFCPLPENEENGHNNYTSTTSEIILLNHLCTFNIGLIFSFVLFIGG